LDVAREFAALSSFFRIYAWCRLLKPSPQNLSLKTPQLPPRRDVGQQRTVLTPLKKGYRFVLALKPILHGLDNTLISTHLVMETSFSPPAASPPLAAFRGAEAPPSYFLLPLDFEHFPFRFFSVLRPLESAFSPLSSWRGAPPWYRLVLPVGVTPESAFFYSCDTILFFALESRIQSLRHSFFLSSRKRTLMENS